VWQRRAAGYGLAAITVHRFFWGLSTIATVLLYRNYFNQTADADNVNGLALVAGAAGLGVLLAAWVTPIVVARSGKDRWIVALLLGSAVVEIALATPFSQVTFLIAALFLGIAAQGV